MPERLSLAERMDLLNDPRMQDPRIRYAVLQQLDPIDREWLSQPDQQKPDAQGALRKVVGGVANYARENPAEAGAIVGGLATAPFTGGMSVPASLAAVGLGGAGGAGLGMLTSAATDPNSPAPRTAGGVLGTMAQQGAIQAGGEGIGRAMGGAMKGTANALQGGILPKRIAEDFPQAADVLNRNLINPTTERGAAKATALRQVSSDKTKQLATQAQQSGAKGITRKDVAGSLKPAGRMARDETDAGLPGGPAQIKRRVDALFGAHPGGEIPLTKAQGVTRVLQDEGIQAREAVQSAERPSRLQSVTADNLAQGVRQTARDRIPGFEAANKETQGLIGAERAAAELKDARVPIRQILGSPRTAIAGGMGIGGFATTGDPLVGLAAGAVPLALGVPQITAPMAIALYQAGRMPYALLVKIVGPASARALGLTPETTR